MFDNLKITTTVKQLDYLCTWTKSTLKKLWYIKTNGLLTLEPEGSPPWSQDIWLQQLEASNFQDSFFQWNGRIYFRNYGIGMGSKPSPYLANLSLCGEELQFLLNLQKTNLSQAKKLGFTSFRYLDDKISICQTKNTFIHPDLEWEPAKDNGFLGVSIRTRGDKLITTTRRTPKLKIHKNGLLSQDTVKSTIQGQILRAINKTPFHGTC